MKTITVNENIALHYIEMKKLKTTVVGTYIRRNMSADEASKNAVLPYVLKSGCKKFPKTRDMALHLQGLYGASLNGGVLKNGDNQILFFDAETISDRYAPNGEKLCKELISLLMSVIFEPYTVDGAFDCDTVKREKQTVKNKLEATINDKRSYAQQRCLEELCKGDAFAISKFGTLEDIDKITPEMLFEHYKNIITSSQIDIFVCGEADFDELGQIVAEYTKNLTFKKAEYQPTKVIARRDETENVTDKMEVTQGKLSVGFTTGINAKDSQYPAMLVANSIYGAGTQSKLFNNVREKLSLAYYASSQYNKYKGFIVMNAGIEFENFKKAYDESMFQLNELKQGKISDDEFNFSKLTLINSINSYYDDQRYMQLYALDSLYLGMDTDPDALKKGIEAVGCDDVIAAAQKITPNIVYFLSGTERK